MENDSNGGGISYFSADFKAMEIDKIIDAIVEKDILERMPDIIKLKQQEDNSDETKKDKE